MISKTKATLLASALLLTPAAALAQNEVTDQANAVEETAEQLQQEANALGNTVALDAGTDETADGDAADDGDERRGDGDDDSGKWGLLGLLGLAGLLGLKRNDRDRDHRGSTGTTGSRTGTGTGTDTRL